MRTVAFDWQHDDWFAALKAGFSPVDETEIDRLENAALEFGWRGRKWREPLPDESSERLRQKILPPFENFAAQLARFKIPADRRATGRCPARTLERFESRTTLERWAFDEDNPQSAIRNPRFTTVWEQMNSWLDNLALAFPREPLPLRDWLPILEAGLASLPSASFRRCSTRF